MKSSTGYMTAAVLVGLMNRESGCCPNLINALSLAKETGVMVLPHHSVSNTHCVCLQNVFMHVNRTFR